VTSFGCGQSMFDCIVSHCSGVVLNAVNSYYPTELDIGYGALSRWIVAILMNPNGNGKISAMTSLSSK
jgi:hypothetical protein